MTFLRVCLCVHASVYSTQHTHTHTHYTYDWEPTPCVHTSFFSTRIFMIFCLVYVLICFCLKMRFNCCKKRENFSWKNHFSWLMFNASIVFSFIWIDWIYKLNRISFHGNKNILEDSRVYVFGFGFLTNYCIQNCV